MKSKTGNPVRSDNDGNKIFPFRWGSMVMFPLDVEVIFLPFKSRSPPSCGVVSSIKFEIPPPPPPEIVEKLKFPLPSVFKT